MSPRMESWRCGGVFVQIVLSVIVLCFSVIAVIGGVGFAVLDAMDKVESIKNRAPWIKKILAKRGAVIALLMTCTVLLIGDGYELVSKELPEVPLPPVLTFPPMSAPHITIYQLAQPVKEQCWIRNYSVPAIPAPPSWGAATIFCNTTIKPPYSVELHYDQNVTVGPFTFPIGSEATKSMESNQGTKIVGMFDLHTIIPNEPFSIMASGSTGIPPFVRIGVIRAKGHVLEFHP
jgi:hypothetical protein